MLVFGYACAVDSSPPRRSAHPSPPSPCSYFGQYYGFNVTNINAAYGPVFVTVGGFTGGIILPATSQPTTLSAGYLAPGESKVVFAYFTIPSSTATSNGAPATFFSARLWRFRPQAHEDASGFELDQPMNFSGVVGTNR